jgi:hypothetical protein
MDHWVDDLARALAGGLSRKQFLRLTGATLSGVILGGNVPASEAKPAARCTPACGWGQVCHKGSCVCQVKKPQPPCSEGRCAQEFSDPCQQDYCEFICNQCQKPTAHRGDFCIARNPNTPPGGKVAAC